MIGRLQKSAGFTLVELLLAVTLMSILLALTYSGLRAATRSSERGEAMLAAGGEVRSAHQFVHRQLNQMLPLAFDTSDAEGEMRVVFEGDASSIQFVAPMPGYLGSGGPQVQLLELANGDNGRVLQFNHALLQSFEASFLTERDPVLLLEHIESARFEFLGREPDGEITEWTSSWDTPDIMPVAVRLNVTFEEGRFMQWPELVAGVRIDEVAVSDSVLGGEYERTIQDLIKGKNRGQQGDRD
jgi:general secretion pathway protein J